MTDTSNEQAASNVTDASNEAAASKRPTHIAYHVRDREGKKGFWSRIGGVWKHEDGNGFTIILDTVPLDGRIIVRIVSETKE